MDEGIRAGLRPKAESPRKRLRVFGFGLGLILGFAAWRWSLKSWAIAPWAGAAAALLAAAAAARPEALAPLERGWMAVVRRVAAVNTYVLLGLLYCLLITPAGLLRRLLAGDPLEGDPPEPGTYWHRRSAARGPESYRWPF